MVCWLSIVLGTYITYLVIDEYQERAGSEFPISIITTVSAILFIITGIYLSKIFCKWFISRSRSIRVFSIIGLFFSTVMSILFVFILMLSAAIGDDFISGLCGEVVISETVSPNGMFKAVIFERDCGAATDFSTQVAIVRNVRTLGKKAKKRILFGADRNHQSAPAGPEGGPEVRLRWISNNRIEIQHHKLAHVFCEKSMSKGVSIKYNTFQ